MKVITSFTLNWDLEIVDEQSYEYDGPVAECKGGGNNTHYENLERLYGVQADQAQVLGNYAKNTVLPAYAGYLQEAQGYGSQANQERAATQAAADSAAATSASKAGFVQHLDSLGINPADQRYSKELSKMGIQGAAQQAAGMSGAREQTRRMGMGYAQDAVALGMGTPTQAANAAAGAANSAAAAGNLYNQNQQAQANGISSAIRGGFDLYGAYKNGGFADGGLVRLKDGGYVHKGLMKPKGYAMGGIVRMGQQPVTPPPPAPGGPAPQDPTAGMVGGITKAATTGPGKQAVGKGLEEAGGMMGSDYVNAMGRGMQGGPGVGLEMDIYKQIAQDKVNSILPSVEGMATDVGTSAAAEAALAEGATEIGTQLATDVGAAAATEAGLAMGANVVPVIGQVVSAAMLAKTAGDALGWWADGGEVDGPGGPKDDAIPAMLSDGEFVMPVGAVKKFGLAKLEKMRQEGLQFEQELGIRRQA